MFNLEQSITEWRRQMLAAGIKTPVPLEELENHLREDFDAQIRAGAAPERAFEIAASRLGLPAAIQHEFGKISEVFPAWMRKFNCTVSPALAQKLSFILFSLALLLMCSMVLFKYGALSQITSAQQLSCLAAAATFTLLIWSGRLGHRLFPVIRAGRTVGFIVLCLLVLLVLWLFVFVFLIVPRCDLTVVQLFVGFFWALLAPSGVIGGLSQGLTTAARKKGAIAVS